MVVQHNLQAMNANRMLGVTTDSQSKATEKLSSGYKINRAADDAAGLTISEKMRKQMRGLDRASTNAQDGVSAVQTAEGALTEVHDMLQRMNELAVQASNGTNSESDREAIQSEIEQLTTEIDRVAETTKFNETYLLKGNASGATQLIYLKGHDAGLNGKLVDGSTQAVFQMTLTQNSIVNIAGNDYLIHDGKHELGSMSAMVKSLAQQTGATITIDGVKYTVTASGGKNQFVTDSGTIYTTQQVVAKIQDRSKVATASSASAKAKTFIAYDKTNTNNITTQQAVGKVTNALIAANSIGVTDGNVGVTAAVSGGKEYTFTVSKGQVEVRKNLTFNLHVGADADMTNKIGVEIQDLSAAGLGIKDLNVKDDSGMAATYAIDAIADALAKVSSQRSALGAVQNRLEHTIKNLDNVVENTTSAESRIRDTDMAEEMVEFSKNNILAQAGQSMLAQANQSNQGVLSLLG